MHQAQFRIGQVIRHTKQNYRGVIIDVDYSFQPQGIHSPIMIKKNIATEHPWYRVLVDNSNHITYVKETLLEDDSYDDVPICHPDLHSYLEIRNGKYILHQSIN